MVQPRPPSCTAEAPPLSPLGQAGSAAPSATSSPDAAAPCTGQCGEGEAVKSAHSKDRASSHLGEHCRIKLRLRSAPLHSSGLALCIGACGPALLGLQHASRHTPHHTLLLAHWVHPIPAWAPETGAFQRQELQVSSSAPAHWPSHRNALQPVAGSPRPSGPHSHSHWSFWPCAGMDPAYHWWQPQGTACFAWPLKGVPAEWPASSGRPVQVNRAGDRGPCTPH